MAYRDDADAREYIGARSGACEKSKEQLERERFTITATGTSA
jgi:hypothetical protein